MEQDVSILRGRKSPQSKLVQLGAASALEKAAGEIAIYARMFRESLATKMPGDLLNSEDCYGTPRRLCIVNIYNQLKGLEPLFNQLAGEPRE